MASALRCDAYQLSGDFSWISRVEPEWVPKKDAATFETLKTRQNVWHGKRATDGLLCPCNHPLPDEERTDDAIKAMLLTALANEAGLAKQMERSEALRQLMSANPDSVIVVGNSAKMELLGNDTGEWIDSHAVVMRFNTNWRADQRHLTGSKRDVWVTGDYKSACGCLGARCCTPEQLAALWDRVGPDAKVYNGQRPAPSEGHGPPPGMTFTQWSSGSLLWNYILWLKSHAHKDIQTIVPPKEPTRTGMSGIFGVILHGIVPKVVGFDSGACMHIDYYEVLRARDEVAEHKGHVLMHYAHEPRILAELDKAGIIQLVEPKVKEDCVRGVARGVLVEPEPTSQPDQLKSLPPNRLKSFTQH
eukprot:jgi/Mesvir1/26465/Mv16139-RA.1